MLNNVSQISKSALDLTWTNIGTIITTSVAIAISGLQHLNGNKTDGKLASTDIISIAVVPVIAVVGIIQSYQKVQKAIPYDLGGQNRELTLINNPETSEIDRLRNFVTDKKRSANFSISEVLTAQVLITLALILVAEFANLSGKSRFACDTIFYTLEAFDYAYNMNLLQNTFDICDTKFRPKGVHPLFQNTVVNFLSQPASAGVIDNQVIAVVANQAPTVEVRTTRRRSILENTFDFLAKASRRNAIANDPNQDGDQAIEAINYIVSNSNLIQVFNQSSSSSSLSLRSVIQSEENTQLPGTLSGLNVSSGDSSSGSSYSSRTSPK